MFNGPGSTTVQPLAATRGSFNLCLVAPINLTKFDYILKDNTISINWQTASESNSDYFDIERSVDGIKFEKIGSIKAAGNSTTTKNYSFIDSKPNYINHYRLKQVDLNGKVDYSRLLFAKVPQASPVIIKTNPVKNNLQLQISIDPSKIKSILLYDFMGRQLKTINAISRYQNVDISNLAIGKYLLQVVTIDNQGYNLPFIKAE